MTRPSRWITCPETTYNKQIRMFWEALSCFFFKTNFFPASIDNTLYIHIHIYIHVFVCVYIYFFSYSSRLTTRGSMGLEFLSLDSTCMLITPSCFKTAQIGFCSALLVFFPQNWQNQIEQQAAFHSITLKYQGSSSPSDGQNIGMVIQK